MGISIVGQYPQETIKLIFIRGLVFFPGFINYLSESIFIGLEKSKHISFAVILRAVLMLFLSWLAVVIGWGLCGVMFAIVIAYSISAVFLISCLMSKGVKIGKIRDKEFRVSDDRK